VALPSHLEIRLRRHLIRLQTAFVRSPNVEGWIGSWSIYVAPVRPGDMPLRYGDTDLHEYEVVALGAAKTVATLVARSLE
jgi:hypothetical protein